jgi:hypothetical protein
MVTGVHLVSIACSQEAVEDPDRALEVFRREVAVTHDHLESLVPEELGNGPEGDAAHGKMAGKAVPQIMKAEILNPARVRAFSNASPTSTYRFPPLCLFQNK